MSGGLNSDTSGDLSFDPNNQGQGPNQGQGQYNDTNRENPAAPELRSEGRGPTQRQEREQCTVKPTAYSQNSGNQRECDPSQATSQPSDPHSDRQDPARDRYDDKTHSSGPGQGYSQPGQQGQWRQGGQTTGDNLPYGGGGRDPHQGGHRHQPVGEPQEKVDSGSYGKTSGTGPGRKYDDQEIRGDGGFGGKPPIPERVMGATEMFVGKATGNVGMYERGQQHKTGGY